MLSEANRFLFLVLNGIFKHMFCAVSTLKINNNILMLTGGGFTSPGEFRTSLSDELKLLPIGLNIQYLFSTNPKFHSTPGVRYDLYPATIECLQMQLQSVSRSFNHVTKCIILSRKHEYWKHCVWAFWLRNQKAHCASSLLSLAVR